MGNQQGKARKPTGDFSKLDALDQLATKYILTQNFQDMKKLSTKPYCDKLIILTGDIIKKFLNEKEIEYLSYKLVNGVPVNKVEKMKVAYLDTNEIKSTTIGKTGLHALDVHNPEIKDRMCKGIAKFYIKIAHLYAAILKTINPLYIFKDVNGKEHHFSLSNKGKIPAGTNVKLTEVNLCTRRINAIKFSNDGKDIKINISKTCDLNRHTQKLGFGTHPNEPSKWGKASVTTRTLGEETGIPELEKLYFDKYDYNTGKYVDMTAESKKQYNKDLSVFYRHFTGKNNYAEWNVSGNKKFSNTPLIDFNASELCKDANSPWNKTYMGKDEGLFKKYANNLKKMMDIAEQNQKNILQILDQVFVWEKKTSDAAKETITINPTLTEKSLDEIVAETRNLILELYYTCEKDFKEGLEIFEAIIKERILKNSEAKSKDLEKKIDSFIMGDENSVVTAPPRQ